MGREVVLWYCGIVVVEVVVRGGDGASWVDGREWSRTWCQGVVGCVVVAVREYGCNSCCCCNMLYVTCQGLTSVSRHPGLGVAVM